MTIAFDEVDDFEIENFPSIRQRIRFKTNRMVGPAKNIFTLRYKNGEEIEYIIDDRVALIEPRFRYAVTAYATHEGYKGRNPKETTMRLTVSLHHGNPEAKPVGTEAMRATEVCYAGYARQRVTATIPYGLIIDTGKVEFPECHPAFKGGDTVTHFGVHGPDFSFYGTVQPSLYITAGCTPILTSVTIPLMEIHNAQKRAEMNRKKIVLTESDLISLEPPRLERPIRYDMWEGESFIIPPLKRYSDITLETYEVSRMLDVWKRGYEKQDFEIHFKTAIFKFSGFVNEVLVTPEVDALARAKVTIKISGPVQTEHIEPMKLKSLKLEQWWKTPLITKKMLEDAARNIAWLTQTRRDAEALLGPATAHKKFPALYGVPYSHIIVDDPLVPKINPPIIGKSPVQAVYDHLKTYVTANEAKAYMYGWDPAKEDKVKELDPELLKQNQFYVGSRIALGLPGSVRGRSFTTGLPWGHETLDEAVEHAEELLKESDGDEQFIVQIIKVVKREPVPVIVADAVPTPRKRTYGGGKRGLRRR